ncbi:MAG: non-canonical purine NTP pyrophosphatase [Pseudomonadales bacterium]|jgi:XTP/dITP diphosphohydrolase|uniref:XTP/dITP diphosphatase n=1 Tax=unclassified Ketobacter TaxID=2639109 RepID=UPI000C919D86|nr:MULTISPECIES: XTP/dITP diphosphatase [unclassified Ketobacter]MAA60592.1 non-canonical purine NTP pyrophosphatase [Pseudomonadales bacterium]MEC8810173.1 XTP/dITP diphosphatase [Pseudomonadota bacterium]TNC89981.1 MAG: non-canonical purine NTP pyrophosphatase [Alcanivorax sp.]HAG95134.1 non-canonical purine NTP pyrophosphatase [Gammaproteobacteria bacterium]MAQ26830.1 non-canonical purine NTP pyrophosphatase [Pseudomonadales bacterium]|tara:strand:- start:1967 stop:2569 length:603 start_codon:yes stop_codon:yes gene_type:complete
MQDIVVATGNQGKLKEINQVLNPFGLKARGQAEFEVPEIEETGLTFVENALLKARNASAITGKPALADDSGLEVDALRGAPGIYSARYAGPEATDADNVAKLLAALEGLPSHQRRARFQCVMVYLRHAEDPVPLICQGTWEGYIADQASGNNGFGYDPVFMVPDQGCSAAQLPPEIKNQLSHRGLALQQLMAAFAARQTA